MPSSPSRTLRLALYLRSQGMREPFVPDIPCDGNMADDTGLEQWVVPALAAQPASGAPGAL